MSPTSPGTHRLPRAGTDPIVDEVTALAVLRMVTHRPVRHETILVLLDDARRGVGIVVVADTHDRDAVVDVAERILDPIVHDGRVAAVVLASVRPADPGGHGDGPDVEPADAERWLELDEVAAGRGVELVEWFVLADEVSRPRELLTAPPRW